MINFSRKRISKDYELSFWVSLKWNGKSLLLFYEKLMRQLIRVLNFLLEEILCVLRHFDKEIKRFKGILS